MTSSTILLIILIATGVGHLTCAGILFFMAKSKSANVMKWVGIGLCLGLIGFALFFMLEGDKPEA